MCGRGVVQFNTPRRLRGVFGSNPNDRTLYFVEINSSSLMKTYKKLISKYHYIGKDWETSFNARTIAWLIYEGGVFVGLIGVRSWSIFINPKAVDNFIGWNKEQRYQNYTKVANNWRFLLLCNEKNLGSRILSKFLKVSKEGWERKFGDKLVLLITFIDPRFTGTVYKASGWVEIGKTAGVGLRKQKIIKTSKKTIFAKPLHRYWKRELLKVKNIKKTVNPRNLSEVFS